MKPSKGLTDKKIICGDVIECKFEFIEFKVKCIYTCKNVFHVASESVFSY